MLLFWNVLNSCVVEWDPPEPEPLYQPIGHERTPVPSAADRGKVVYCTDHGNFLQGFFIVVVLPPGNREEQHTNLTHHNGAERFF